MLSKIKSKYGYTHTVIDHKYSIWHCKIAIDCLTGFMPMIAGVNVEIVNICRKGVSKRMYILSYCTLDFENHERMQIELTLHLEEHAVRRVKRKYAWVHGTTGEETVPSDWTQEMELM
jgi:hypothetical protein